MAEENTAHHEEISTEDAALVLARLFHAPRELVYKAWTESESLRQWWGPKGFTMGISNLDLRPGGVFLYSMVSPQGHVMWGKFIYREIVAPSKLIFTSSFSDELGSTVRHPLSPTWPLEILNTLTFSEHEGRTTLTLRGAPLSATEAELQTFHAAHDSIRQGFTGTFDSLADYLAKA